MLKNFIAVCVIVTMTCTIAFSAGNEFVKSKLPMEKKQEIYSYFTRANRTYDFDAAYNFTAKQFKISKKHVIKIVTEGTMDDWNGLYTQQPSAKSQQQIQKEKTEFGAAAYRYSEKVRTGKDLP